MRTYLDCIPCFYNQALKTARIAGASEEDQREVLNKISELIPYFSLNTTPAEMGRKVYRIVSKVTGKKDPYREIKEESNKMALKEYEKMKLRVKDSTNPLRTAIGLAIIGNLIDFGIKDPSTIQGEIDQMLNSEFELKTTNQNEHFDYLAFQQSLFDTESVLYLADNSGEVVFDRILIEYIVNEYHKNVIYAVKGKPVLNDALVEDAISCGINHFANIISCGADSPGVILKYCSPEFIRLFNDAEMIISKGQGNYEALSNEKNNLFFLLVAKCPVIARHVGCHIGDFILEKSVKYQELSIEYTES